MLNVISIYDATCIYFMILAKIVLLFTGFYDLNCITIYCVTSFNNTLKLIEEN